MTGQELLTYRMDKEEQVIWYRFCVDVKNKLVALQLEPYAYEVMNNCLLKGSPYDYMNGYTKSGGYYYVIAGDRGHWTLIYQTESYEEAWNERLRRLADSIAYQCTVKNKDSIEQQHRHLWRYYQIFDRREANRIYYRDVENASWIYDTEYDYRKYWFEMALYIMKTTVSKETFDQEVVRYEKLLNRWFDSPFWAYDKDKMEFVTLKNFT